MRLACKQMIAIAWLTALETVRQPICLILTTSAILFIGVLPLVVNYTFGETGKVIRDSGLAVFLLMGVLLSTYAACLSITREMKSGTISAVLSKPVDRTLFLLAKFAGITGIILLYCLLVAMAVIMSERTVSELYEIDFYSAGSLLMAPFAAYLIAALINYFSDRNFVSNAFALQVICVMLAFVWTGFMDRTGAMQAFGLLYNWKLIPAAMLLTMALLTLLAIAVTLATRLDAVPTLVICSVVLIVGLLSDYFFGRHAETSWWAEICYAVVPNWQHFWVVDGLTGGGEIQWSVVWATGRYALLYTTGVLCLAVSLFNFSEIK